MKHQRIIKGNSTTIPSHSEVISDYQTYAVTEKERPGKGNIPLNSETCIVASREFMIENKK